MVKELRMPFGSTSVKRCCGPIRTCSLDEQPREQKGHSASWLTLRRAEMRRLLGRQLEGDSISKVSAESASRNASSSHWGASVCIHDPNHLNPGKRRIRGGWLKTVCSLKPCSLQLFFWQHFSFVLCSMNVTHLLEFSMEELTRPSKSWQLQCISDLGAGTGSNTSFTLSAGVTLEHCSVSTEFEIETRQKIYRKVIIVTLSVFSMLHF